MRAQREPVSLDGLMGRESDRFNLGAVVSDPGATDPAQRAVTADRHRVIAELLATLSEREQEVVRRRFGFADDPPHVLQEIGSGYGISRERVRQIEAAALRRLRVQARSRRLQDYL
jgi:RNA polymerase primary sigma factor